MKANIAFKIDAETKRQFRIRLINERQTQAEVLRRLVEWYVKHGLPGGDDAELGT